MLLRDEEFNGVPAAIDRLQELFPDADIGRMVEYQPLMLVEDLNNVMEQLRRYALLDYNRGPKSCRYKVSRALLHGQLWLLCKVCWSCCVCMAGLHKVLFFCRSCRSL